MIALQEMLGVTKAGSPDPSWGGQRARLRDRCTANVARLNVLVEISIGGGGRGGDLRFLRNVTAPEWRGEICLCGGVSHP